MHAYVTGHDVGVAAATSGASDERSGRARDGRRDSACSGHHATRRRGDIVVSRRGIDVLHAYVRGRDVGRGLLLLHASQI